ncbi:hypothetical protein [Prosthecomicrobium hirschii]|uniref:hypothetical protein n=1 Tax=Prosthecodimorpha hirschii TaxID=665126 RepID=UPI00221E6083|nr:hypothetical protein [Prosthecomicrobium hirschii]MCW1840738.1 hypothetical protein [Prosthecomicrobium hirschii]
MTASRRARIRIGGPLPSWLARTVLFAYVLAAALAGFGHSPARFDTAAASERAAFVLPDGTVPTLCGDPAGPGKADRSLCDACRLSAAPGLPPIAGLGFPPVRGAHPAAPLPDAPSLPVRVASCRQRGPPAGLGLRSEAVPAFGGPLSLAAACAPNLSRDSDVARP